MVKAQLIQDTVESGVGIGFGADADWFTIGEAEWGGLGRGACRNTVDIEDDLVTGFERYGDMVPFLGVSRPVDS